MHDVDLQSKRAHLGLGSNVGDRRAAILGALRALDAMPEISVQAVSRLYETEPVGPAGQGPYLNAAAALAVTISPRELLERCLVIERAAGRERRAEQRWGPRRLDLDVLLFGDMVIDKPGLTVPHPRLHERMFVLQPLAEIAGNLVHPVLGQHVQEMQAALAASGAKPGVPQGPAVFADREVR